MSALKIRCMFLSLPARNHVTPGQSILVYFKPVLSFHFSFSWCTRGEKQINIIQGLISTRLCVWQNHQTTGWTRQSLFGNLSYFYRMSKLIWKSHVNLDHSKLHKDPCSLGIHSLSITVSPIMMSNSYISTC